MSHKCSKPGGSETNGGTRAPSKSSSKKPGKRHRRAASASDSAAAAKGEGGLSTPRATELTGELSAEVLRDFAEPLSFSTAWRSEGPTERANNANEAELTRDMSAGCRFLHASRRCDATH